MTGHHRIVVAGCGNVGQAVVQLMADRHPATAGLELAGVCDPRYGTVVSKDAIDPGALLAGVGQGSLAGLPEHAGSIGVVEMIDATEADTLVELTFTDLESGEPATTHIRHALEAGLNVSTTNKGPIALHFVELDKLAEANGVKLAFEGTVMSGSPALHLADVIKGAGFNGAVGILNGTTNYVITRMEEGAKYEEALREAQELGYAEADPSGDVDGHDAAGKLAILAHLLTDSALAPAGIDRKPLVTLTSDDIAQAASDGQCWRYVAVLEPKDGGWAGSVAPRRLPRTHPLASIAGATNAITYETELLDEVTLVGPGAGRQATAFAVLSDLRQIMKEEA